MYEELYQLAAPIVLLNRAVAVARWQGAAAGIRLFAEIEHYLSLRTYHLLPAVVADLWWQTGDHHRATMYYQTALALPCTEPERQFLQRQLCQLEFPETAR